VFLISDLCSLLDTYLEHDEVKKIYRAYLFGAEAHDGQMRVSGEPYIYHPIAVARILADMHMDYETIVAAILHDVIEDTPTVKDQLTREFGEEVAELVDGVSKLTQIEFESSAHAQAENFRKMLMAVARDIRVIIVKLADRLHNMRTLGALPPVKRRAIARETLDIYAPIAQRLGMNSIRLELEDLGFAACYPMRSRVLSNEVKKARGHRKEIIGKLEKAIKRRMRQEKIKGEMHAREKHLYSVYKKMAEKRLPFDEVYDVYAVRIIVETVGQCYQMIGVVHNLYKPVPGKFKDYVAIPKANGYQSLHTVLFGPHGIPIEVQIRTRDMDEVAEIGIAAHWLYKAGADDQRPNSAHKRAREWLRNILEMQRNAGDSIEFLEHVKIDLFPDTVYVFTPKGKIMQLPSGATAVDFAYAVHSDVGNSCVAARIDKRLSPLGTRLSNGQTVEVITSANARPNPAWLNFAVSGKARSAIRHYLKSLQVDEAIILGRRMLDRELTAYQTSIEELPPDRLQSTLEDFGNKSVDGLYAEIGLGQRMAPIVARRLAAPAEDGGGGEHAAPHGTTPLVIKGTEGMVVNFPKCCHPIPGDPILGLVTTGRGIVIHNQHCRTTREFREDADKWIDVEWGENLERDFPVAIRIDVANQPGVLATIAAAISDSDANIENVRTDHRDGLSTDLGFIIAVRDRQHLAQVMRRVRGIRAVNRISRGQW